MPAQLIAYVTHTSKKSSLGDDDIMDKGGNALKKIFILLRTQLGHDFSQYKPKTINRRIDRRMAVHQIETLDGYVKYLQKTPAEVEALFRDLLIGVTSFFRDPEAFMALESQIIPKLFSNKPAGGIVRVWSLGCSTGEEAYSIAILLQEHLTTLKQSYKVQVFATDIDSRAVATARAGLYPASIAIDLTPERLARFFTLEANGTAYRIHKSIRDMMIFSEQDVIKDPPFSKLDLISCRNLLIYMGGALQKKLIPLFHYALNPGGMLFLGGAPHGATCGTGPAYAPYSGISGRTPCWPREGERPQKTLATRTDGTGAFTTGRPCGRPHQRPGRHSLSSRPHGNVSGADTRRNRYQ
jgi:two-component system CheB/CheR fusion protein